MKPQNSSTDAATQPTDMPLPLHLLDMYGISKSGIGRQLGITPNRIKRALDVETFASIKHRDLTRIRQQVEKLVRAAGWQGKAESLWEEYDQTLNDQAA